MPDLRVQRLVTNSLIHLNCTYKFSSYHTEDAIHVLYTNQSINTVQESKRFYFKNDKIHMNTHFERCAVFITLEDVVRKLPTSLKMSAVRVIQCILSFLHVVFSNQSPIPFPAPPKRNVQTADIENFSSGNLQTIQVTVVVLCETQRPNVRLNNKYSCFVREKNPT